ncbi:MAG: hypothetical protein JWQ66_1226 [Mucilaginibacter sp.]|nr:hypothetical protein [Mucilaginibacter sp.]
MKTASNNDQTEKNENLNIEYILRTNGYLFPETINEVIEYEKKFGDTDITLPDDMKIPDFLNKPLSLKSEKPVKEKTIQENFVLAARMENCSSLPDHIKKRMEEDKNKNI